MKVIPAVLQSSHILKGKKLTVKPKEIKTWQKKKTKSATAPPVQTENINKIDHIRLMNALKLSNKVRIYIYLDSFSY